MINSWIRWRNKAHTCILKEGIMRKMKCDDIMMSKRASWITDTGVNLNSIPFKVPKITFHVEWSVIASSRLTKVIFAYFQHIDLVFFIFSLVTDLFHNRIATFFYSKVTKLCNQLHPSHFYIIYCIQHAQKDNMFCFPTIKKKKQWKINTSRKLATLNLVM